MRLLYFLLVFLFISPFTFAQKQSLQQVLEKETAGFRGDVGIYVLHLKTGEEAAINADTIFPTASIVKVPILVGVMDKIEKGELAYHQKMVYRDSIKYGGSGLMQYFKDSTETELSILMSLMITYSDNTTSLWCQALAGGGERINEIMEGLGLQHTRVNSRTPGREDIWKKYGWGQTTPREMAQLLIKIRKGEIISLAASDRMYRLMGNIYYDEYALSAIPAQVHTASKQGMVNASRSELVMVNAPKGDYVFYFATKNNEDQRWEDDNEAQFLQKTISKILWEWFEGD
ncbi:class A beta-lactamase-related serine hydrolase [Aquiflexum sp. LQ15W]|uniref:serine hydrolase n=1 Tax=Cognataquiflexum nitidum TaxID=2922272 RepID=UPI001F149540|nr:serine hydrolase [Cognataquiflexum nitidum]MCH6199499.1 class A beta-lactamase-related serine hydrolase [Cognataquiflexum nitidum]